MVAPLWLLLWLCESIDANPLLPLPGYWGDKTIDAREDLARIENIDQYPQGANGQDSLPIVQGVQFSCGVHSSIFQ